jgi:hypothetical protein
MHSTCSCKRLLYDSYWEIKRSSTTPSLEHSSLLNHESFLINIHHSELSIHYKPASLEANLFASPVCSESLIGRRGQSQESEKYPSKALRIPSSNNKIKIKDAQKCCSAYAIQNQTFSRKFLGICSGQTSASRAALPVQRSASEALTNLVFL